MALGAHSWSALHGRAPHPESLEPAPSAGSLPRFRARFSGSLAMASPLQPKSVFTNLFVESALRMSQRQFLATIFFLLN